MTHWIKKTSNVENEERSEDGDSSTGAPGTSTQNIQDTGIVTMNGQIAPKIDNPIDFKNIDLSQNYRAELSEFDNFEDINEVGDLFDEVEDYYSQKMMVVPEEFQPWDNNIETSELDERLKTNLVKGMKFGKLNALQIHSIPMILSGKPLIVQAPTGIGKTAAFLIPAIQKVIDIKTSNRAKYSVPTPYVLILNNTKHLADQTYDRSLLMVGMMPNDQCRNIDEVYIDSYTAGRKNQMKLNCDIAVATMGALQDKLNNKQISLSRLKLLIIDEADKMTSRDAFGCEVETIYDNLDDEVKEDLQVCFFSATYADDELGKDDDLILKLIRNYEETSKIWIPAMPGHITQKVITINTGYDSFDYIQKLNQVMKAIDLDLKRTGCSKEGPYEETIGVFVETCGKVNMVAYALQAAGYNFWPVSSKIDKAQQRINVNKLKTKKIQGIVTTNILARGTDISSIRHIIVMEMSTDFHTYRHRIGRTGRAGHGGNATVLLNPNHYRRQDQLVVINLVEFLHENEQNIPEWMAIFFNSWQEQMKNAC